MKKNFKKPTKPMYIAIQDIGIELKYDNSKEFKKRILNITDDKYSRNISKIEKKLEIEIIELYSKNFKLLNDKGHGNLGFNISSEHRLSPTNKDYIGIINLDEKFKIENLFENNNQYTYYRIHSKNNSILYNLFLLQYYHLYDKAPTDEDYKKFIDQNKDKISDYSKFDSDKYCDSDFLKEKILNLVNLCKTLSNIFNYSFLLIQDAIIYDSSDIQNKNIILCANKENIEIALQKDIVLLYFYIDSTRCYLEPIIIVSDKEQKIQYLIPSNSIEQHKILLENYTILEDNTLEEQQQQDIQLKQDIKTTDYILFNPQDKNTELPQIDIQLDDTLKKNNTYLLGNRYIENTMDFYNIYEDDNKENNLAGKVNLISDKELEVYWCINHPKTN